MASIEKYRLWFAQEKSANEKLLEMLRSVPEDRRSDARYARALVLAAHLCACRENWLDRMAAGGTAQTDWWPERAELGELPTRFHDVERRWTEYLAGIGDEDLDVDFDFPTSNGTGFRWNIEGQIVQLVGHAFYHRGQIALLVEQLEGEVVNTDYLYWAFEQQPDRWKSISWPTP